MLETAGSFGDTYASQRCAAMLAGWVVVPPVGREPIASGKGECQANHIDAWYVVDELTQAVSQPDVLESFSQDAEPSEVRRCGAQLRRVIQGSDVAATLQAIQEAPTDVLNDRDPVYGWS
eukprot:2468197-Amphidinium_carterae.1